MENTTLSRADRLDKIFGTPVFAVLLAIFCNVLWGSAFPFIKLGYRLFAIDSSNTASIFCFAGVRLMLGCFLVLLGSVLLATAVLSFLMKQSQAIEALQMLIGGFVIFMIPQVVGSVVVFLELAAATIRQVWYI